MQKCLQFLPNQMNLLGSFLFSWMMENETKLVYSFHVCTQVGSHHTVTLTAL